jgi:hypothetical protein
VRQASLEDEVAPEALSDVEVVDVWDDAREARDSLGFASATLAATRHNGWVIGQRRRTKLCGFRSAASRDPVAVMERRCNSSLPIPACGVSRVSPFSAADAQ